MLDCGHGDTARLRFRPIIMTSLTAAAGAIPLIISGGAGSETRSGIGITLLCGVLAAMVVTLVIVPAAYSLLAKGTGSPQDVTRRLRHEEKDAPEANLSPAA